MEVYKISPSCIVLFRVQKDLKLSDSLTSEMSSRKCPQISNLCSILLSEYSTVKDIRRQKEAI